MPDTCLIPETDCASLLADHERQPCEVWTRVMGYHRPAASFNTGKKGEYEERLHFREKHDRRRD